MTQPLHQDYMQPHPAVLQYIRNFARTYKPQTPSC